MAYDPEKYRDKREKVLGIRKRSLSFQTMAIIVSLAIITGLGIVAVPEAITYIATRNLDDAIYKLDGDRSWPKTIIPDVQGINGVETAATDKHETRLVITFDRTVVETGAFLTLFKQNGLEPALLNRVSHRQRLIILEEEEKLEAL